MTRSIFRTLSARLACSALLLSPAAALAQAAPPTPMGGMHEGMAGHDKMMPGMKHDGMKAGMKKSSCMSKAGMQKMGMSQKKMAQMGSMCRAEKKSGMAPAAAKPKPMQPMSSEHDM